MFFNAFGEKYCLNISWNHGQDLKIAQGCCLLIVFNVGRVWMYYWWKVKFFKPFNSLFPENTSIRLIHNCLFVTFQTLQSWISTNLHYTSQTASVRSNNILSENLHSLCTFFTAIKPSQDAVIYFHTYA
mgnify:CR=1 FL=1